MDCGLQSHVVCYVDQFGTGKPERLEDFGNQWLNAIGSQCCRIDKHGRPKCSVILNAHLKLFHREKQTRWKATSEITGWPEAVLVVFSHGYSKPGCKVIYADGK